MVVLHNQHKQELEDAHVRDCHPSPVEKDELFEKVRRGFGSEGISETWDLLDTWYGNWVRGQICR